MRVSVTSMEEVNISLRSIEAYTMPHLSSSVGDKLGDRGLSGGLASIIIA